MVKIVSLLQKLNKFKFKTKFFILTLNTKMCMKYCFETIIM